MPPASLIDQIAGCLVLFLFALCAFYVAGNALGLLPTF